MPAPLIPRAETLQLIRGGASDTEILARLAGRGITVTPQALTQFRRRNGIAPRQQGTKAHGALLPWRVRREHAASQIPTMLRHESRHRRGDRLDDRQEKERAALHKRLAELAAETGRRHVVAYTPERGFEYVPARPQDTDLIRVPD